MFMSNTYTLKCENVKVKKNPQKTDKQTNKQYTNNKTLI